MADSPRANVFLFVRDPSAGPVKTRLAAGCGEEPARNLYVLMAEMLAHDLAPIDDDTHRLHLYVTPAHSNQAVMQWLFPQPATGVTAIPQPETTLDDRMQHALDQFDGPAILLGTDCPGISRGDIARITALLSAVDAVVGPANDGGFWTLGLARRAANLLTGLPTSSADTLDQLRARLADRHLRTLEIEMRADIDTIDDLVMLDDTVRLRLMDTARRRGMAMPEGLQP